MPHPLSLWPSLLPPPQMAALSARQRWCSLTGWDKFEMQRVTKQKRELWRNQTGMVYSPVLKGRTNKAMKVKSPVVVRRRDARSCGTRSGWNCGASWRASILTEASWSPFWSTPSAWALSTTSRYGWLFTFVHVSSSTPLIYFIIYEIFHCLIKYLNILIISLSLSYIWGLCTRVQKLSDNTRFFMLLYTMFPFLYY